MLISGNRKIMGTHANAALLNILGWHTAAVMTCAAAGMVLTL